MPNRVTVLPPQSETADTVSQQISTAIKLAVEALVGFMGRPQPIMVDKAEAARLCDMSENTFDKYVKLGLLPPMNATGKVCLETLRQACLKLDGTKESRLRRDPAEAALAQWEQG